MSAECGVRNAESGAGMQERVRETIAQMRSDFVAVACDPEPTQPAPLQFRRVPMDAEAVDTKAPAQLSPWDAKQRRALLILGVCLGLPACVCRKGGVLQRGVLIFDGSRFCVGPLVLHPSSGWCVTVEPDLITIHLGGLA